MSQCKKRQRSAKDIQATKQLIRFEAAVAVALMTTPLHHMMTSTCEDIRARQMGHSLGLGRRRKQLLQT